MRYDVIVYLLISGDPFPQKICEVTDIPPNEVLTVFTNMYYAFVSSVVEYAINVQAHKED